MAIHRTKFKIAYFYILIFVVACFYGAKLINSACNYQEADKEYSKKEIVLQEDKLRLAFNNGYISIYNGKIQLTENSGLACFFSVKGVAYSSFKAIWKIEKAESGEFIAAAIWPGLTTRQTWHFLLKDRKISWQVVLESDEDITINHVGLVFSFRNIYQEWVSAYAQGIMPVLKALQQREDVNLQVTLNALGLIAADRDARFFPMLGLSLGEGEFLNEVLLSSCRDMFTGSTFSSLAASGTDPLKMLKKEKLNLSSGEINLFDKKGDLLRYLEVKQKKIEIRK
jgi:hypothetical protein